MPVSVGDRVASDPPSAVWLPHHWQVSQPVNFATLWSKGGLYNQCLAAGQLLALLHQHQHQQQHQQHRRLQHQYQHQHHQHQQYQQHQQHLSPAAIVSILARKGLFEANLLNIDIAYWLVLNTTQASIGSHWQQNEDWWRNNLNENLSFNPLYTNICIVHLSVAWPVFIYLGLTKRGFYKDKV